MKPAHFTFATVASGVMTPQMKGLAMKATLRQATKLLELVTASEITSERLQELLSSGLLTDLLTFPDPRGVDRRAFRKLGLGHAGMPSFLVDLLGDQFDFEHRMSAFLASDPTPLRETAVNERNFPIPGLGQGASVYVYLFSPSRDGLTASEVVEEMAARDLEPASVEHALALGAQYGYLLNDEKDPQSVFFLGSRVKRHGIERCPRLGFERDTWGWGVYSSEIESGGNVRHFSRRDSVFAAIRATHVVSVAAGEAAAARR